MTVRVLHGDCLALLPTLGPFHACVTDPPYGLEFMGKEWDKFGDVRKANRGTLTNMVNPDGKPKFGTKAPAFDLSARGRLSYQEWCTAWARAVFDALLPGAHLVAFGGTRTWHRMAVAIEDAGFEIRDTLCWLYGSGFPKSRNVGKAIDWMAGARDSAGIGYTNAKNEFKVTGLATEAARQWEGWGTALKPAFEPIILARKPLGAGTVATNVLAHGCGALNIDGCRIAVTEADQRDVGRQITRNVRSEDGWGMNAAQAESGVTVVRADGRWPANVVHDGSGEVLAAFPDAPGQIAAAILYLTDPTA